MLAEERRAPMADIHLDGAVEKPDPVELLWLFPHIAEVDIGFQPVGVLPCRLAQALIDLIGRQHGHRRPGQHWDVRTLDFCHVILLLPETP